MVDRLIVTAIMLLMVAVVALSLGAVDFICHELSGTGMWEM